MSEADDGGADGSVAQGAVVRRARKQNPLTSRIKRLMQTDEDVGKIAQATPGLIGARYRCAQVPQAFLAVQSTDRCERNQQAKK